MDKLPIFCDLSFWHNLFYSTLILNQEYYLFFKDFCLDQEFIKFIQNFINIENIFFKLDNSLHLSIDTYFSFIQYDLLNSQNDFFPIFENQHYNHLLLYEEYFALFNTFSNINYNLFILDYYILFWELLFDFYDITDLISSYDDYQEIIRRNFNWYFYSFNTLSLDWLFGLDYSWDPQQFSFIKKNYYQNPNFSTKNFFFDNSILNQFLTANNLFFFYKIYFYNICKILIYSFDPFLIFSTGTYYSPIYFNGSSLWNFDTTLIYFSYYNINWYTSFDTESLYLLISWQTNLLSYFYSLPLYTWYKHTSVIHTSFDFLKFNTLDFTFQFIDLLNYNNPYIYNNSFIIFNDHSNYLNEIYNYISFYNFNFIYFLIVELIKYYFLEVFVYFLINCGFFLNPIIELSNILHVYDSFFLVNDHIIINSKFFIYLFIIFLLFFFFFYISKIFLYFIFYIIYFLILYLQYLIIYFQLNNYFWNIYFFFIKLNFNIPYTIFGKTHYKLIALNSSFKKFLDIIFKYKNIKFFLNFIISPKNIKIVWTNILGIWSYFFYKLQVLNLKIVGIRLSLKFKYIIWKKFNIILNKSNIYLVKYNNINKKRYIKINFFSHWFTIKNYFFFYIFLFFKKLRKFIYFSFFFFIKFFFYKFFKFIIKFNLINLKIIIFYLFNIFLLFKLFLNLITYKFIVFLYLKIKINKIIFMNMFLHKFIYKFFIQFTHLDIYYINSDILENFPYYQSNFFINFMNIFLPLTYKVNKIIYINYFFKFIYFNFFKIFNIFFKNIFLFIFILFNYLFYWKNLYIFIIINFLIFIFYIIITFNYKFFFYLIKLFLSKNNLIKLFFKFINYNIKYVILYNIKYNLLKFYVNKLFFFLLSIFFLFFILFYFFNLYFLYFIFLYTFSFIFIKLINININVLSSKFIVNFGYFCCFFFDFIKNILKYIFNIFYIFFLYFIFYPFILFIFLFIFYNNNIFIHLFFFNFFEDIISLFLQNIYLLLNQFDEFIIISYLDLYSYSYTKLFWTFSDSSIVYIDKYTFSNKMWFYKLLSIIYDPISSDAIYLHSPIRRTKTLIHHPHNINIKNLLTKKFHYTMTYNVNDLYFKYPRQKLFYLGKEKNPLFFQINNYKLKFFYKYISWPHYNKLYLVDNDLFNWFYFFKWWFKLSNNQFKLPESFIIHDILYNKNHINLFNKQFNLFIYQPINKFISNYINFMYKYFYKYLYNFSDFYYSLDKKEKIYLFFLDLWNNLIFFIKHYQQIYNNYGSILLCIIYIFEDCSLIISIISEFFFFLILVIIKFIFYNFLYFFLYIFFYYKLYIVIPFSWFNFFHFTFYDIFFFIFYSFLDLICDYIYIFMYNILYIDLPHYFIQNFLNFFFYIFEYYIIYFKIYNIINKINYVINNIYYLLYYIFYLDSVSFIFNWIFDLFFSFFFIFNWIFNIFFYFFLDILYNLNLFFIYKYLFFYTNIEFIIYKLYFKFNTLNYTFISWYRFPIEDLKLFKNPDFYWLKYPSVLHNILSFHDNNLKFYSTDIIKVLNWIEFININPYFFNNILDIINNQTILDYPNSYFFDWNIWYIFWYYFFFFYFFSFFILLFIYRYLYLNNSELNYINSSTIYNWENFRNKILDNDLKLLKNNKIINDYYLKEIANSNYINFKINKDLGWKLWRQKQIEKEDLILNNIKINIEEKRKIRVKRLLPIITDLLQKNINIYSEIFIKYINIKNIYIKLFNKFKFAKKKRKIKKINKRFNKYIYKYKIPKFKFIFKNFKKYMNYFLLNYKTSDLNLTFIKNYKFKFKPISLTKKLNFSFKNLIIFDKFKFLHNFSLIEKFKHDLFFLYYYKLHYSIDSIYNYFSDVNDYSGSMSLFMFKKDYKYLSNKLYNLYFFYKWFDNLFFFNKGSIYFFHKDPTIPFVGYSIEAIDNKQPNTFIFNSSFDISKYDFFYCLLFLMVPYLLFIKIILYSLINYNFSLENYNIIEIYTLKLYYGFTLLLSSFETLHTNIYKILFSNLYNNYDYSFDQIYSNEWESVRSDRSKFIKHNIFYNNQLNTLFPLSKYFTVKYLLSDELFLINTNNNYDIFNYKKYHNYYLYNFENFFIIYDIFYINFIKIDSYSSFIIFYNIFRFILFLLLLLLLFYNNNRILKFFVYTKVNFSNFTFSNIKLNNIINNIKNK